MKGCHSATEKQHPKKTPAFTMSVRRNVRLRREYLYRKGLEGKERALYDHKQQLKEAIRSAYPPSVLLLVLAFSRLQLQVQDND